MARRCIAWSSLSLFLLVCAGASADSWAPPRVQVVASGSGEQLVRVEPARRGADAPRAVRYRHDAAGERYVKDATFALPHRTAPVFVLLTDDGTLVTLDEWAQVGRGPVLLVHDAAGKQRHRYTLAGLLGETAAAAAPASVSSTWWRCGEPLLISGGHVLRVTIYDEGELRVDLRDGSVDYRPGKGRCR